MTQPKPDFAEPPRLIAGDAPLSHLLERANREFATSAKETEAFCQAHARVPKAPWLRDVFQSLAPALLVAAAICALLIAKLLPSAAPADLARSARVAPSAVSSAIAAGAPVSAPARPGPAVATETTTALRPGKNPLPDGSIIDLGASSAGKVRQGLRATEVLLERGRVELEVAHQPAERGLAVSSGAYRFEVRGTVFSVVSNPSAVELSVSEGRVAVWMGTTLLTEVMAGGRWSSAPPKAKSPSEAAPARAPALGSSTASKAVELPLPSETVAPPVPAPDCLAEARAGRTREALACFGEQANGSDLRAEVALFESARLRKDVLGDRTGALQALREYRSRFAKGSLRREVDISYIQLLAELGQDRQALLESAQVLASATGRERGFELHMLRGRIYQNRLADLRSAEGEYAEAERFGGAAAAEASYQRGRCLEGLGDRSGATAAYLRCLKQAGAKRSAEVRERLERLSP